MIIRTLPSQNNLVLFSSMILIWIVYNHIYWIQYKYLHRFRNNLQHIDELFLSKKKSLCAIAYRPDLIPSISSIL